jgi:hypothetical protein
MNPALIAALTPLISDIITEVVPKIIEKLEEEAGKRNREDERDPWNNTDYNRELDKIARDVCSPPPGTEGYQADKITAGKRLNALESLARIQHESLNLLTGRMATTERIAKVRTGDMLNSNLRMASEEEKLKALIEEVKDNAANILDHHNRLDDLGSLDVQLLETAEQTARDARKLAEGVKDRLRDLESRQDYEATTQETAQNAQKMAQGVDTRLCGVERQIRGLAIGGHRHGRLEERIEDLAEQADGQYLQIKGANERIRELVADRAETYETKTPEPPDTTTIDPGMGKPPEKRPPRTLHESLGLPEGAKGSSDFRTLGLPGDVEVSSYDPAADQDVVPASVEEEDL